MADKTKPNLEETASASTLAAAYASGAVSIPVSEDAEGNADTQNPAPSTETRPYTMVFFDLDGTLLPMDTQAFLDAYMKNLAAFMAQHGIDPDLGMKALFAGIKAMGKNDGSISNRDAFWQVYETVTGQAAEDAEEPLPAILRRPLQRYFRAWRTPTPLLRAPWQRSSARATAWRLPPCPCSRLKRCTRAYAGQALIQPTSSS